MAIPKLAMLFSRLYKSKEFKDFQKENEKAFLCAGFFILRIKENLNDFSLDFRNDTQIYSFKIPENKNPDCSEVKGIFKVTTGNESQQSCGVSNPVATNEKDAITIVVDKIMDNQKPLDELEINEKTVLKIDLPVLQTIIQEQLKKQKLNSPLSEIISVLQMNEGKLIWNLTIMLEGFTIITSQMNPISGEVIKFEKKNLFDFVKPKKLK